MGHIYSAKDWSSQQVQAHSKRLTELHHACEFDASSPSRFDKVLALLPDDVPDLSILAKETGSVTRWLKLRSGRQLLRLLMLYALPKMSLKLVATMALFFQVDLTDDALRYRFRNAVPFLQSLLTHLLCPATTHANVPSTGLRLRLQDASNLQRPGTSEPDWRLHTVFDFARQRPVHIELSDARTPESLSRSRDDGVLSLYVADRGLGHARQVHLIKNRYQSECLLRTHLNCIRLLDQTGQVLKPERVLKASETGTYDFDVIVPHPDDRSQRCTARLIVVPLPEEAANRARSKVIKRAKKKGKTPRKESLRMAGFMTLITTLDRSDASARACCRCYRYRWAIEVFFKRCKSILKLNDLGASKDALSEAEIMSKIILVAMLHRRVVVEAMKPEWKATGELPASIWGQTVLLHKALILAVIPRGVQEMLINGLSSAILEKLRPRARSRRTLLERLANDPSWLVLCDTTCVL